MNPAAQFGKRTEALVAEVGDFFCFSGASLRYVLTHGLRRRNLRLLMPQMYSIGVLSMPVVMITGIFVGAVLSAQSVQQFQAMGIMSRMGTMVILSVLKELGPVLAGVLLAGRVGGGLTAELGTMRVTEQIDALRAMGTSPLRVLVVPRFMACILLMPMLVIFANAMGILGGYAVSSLVYAVSRADFWWHPMQVVTYLDLFEGPFKSLFFGIAISLICCFKGFRCEPGAAGVGKACTESFVACCMAILALDLFLIMIINKIDFLLHGVTPMA